MIWLAVKAWFASVPRVVFVCFGIGAALLAGAGYIFHAGRTSKANENATTTLERAAEVAKPITDDERARVMRQYDRNRRDLH